MNQSETALSTKALFMHAWDLHNEGTDKLMKWMQDVGLNVMCIAGTYHSGWFVHPHSSPHVYMTEGGSFYFPPNEKLYLNTPLRPRVASLGRKANWLAAAGDRLEKYGLRMVSWTIGVHNTTLGLRFPQYTQINAYGDSIPHALSIGHDATREYLKAMCRDLAVNYPMHGLQLEAFGWMGLRHGHHHERDLTGLSALEAELLAMCFNPETMRKAQMAGIDAQGARAIVKSTLDASFRNAPDRPANHPQTMEELESRSPDLKEFNLFRKTLVDSLIHEIKTESLQGTSCRLYLESPYDAGIAASCDGFATRVYGARPHQVYEVVKGGTEALPPQWNGEFHCYIRLGMGVPSSAAELRDIVLAVKQGGATGIYFYNYSEAPSKMLGWLNSALADT